MKIAESDNSSNNKENIYNYIYAFNISPEDCQPSGSVNSSRLLDYKWQIMSTDIGHQLIKDTNITIADHMNDNITHKDSQWLDIWNELNQSDPLYTDDHTNDIRELENNLDFDFDVDDIIIHVLKTESTESIDKLLNNSNISQEKKQNCSSSSKTFSSEPIVTANYVMLSADERNAISKVPHDRFLINQLKF